MISIQKNLSELEKSHQLRTVALECYLSAINNMAQYTVDLDASITVPHRNYLSNLAGEVAEAVSYTHLDVYKRQRSTRLSAGRAGSFREIRHLRL